MTTDLTDFKPIVNEMLSEIAALGYFDSVNDHETDNAPGQGLHAMCWIMAMAPAAAASGLNVTSAYLEWNIRLMSTTQAHPRGIVDIGLSNACAAVMRAYNANFRLGGILMNVDIFGKYGKGMRAVAGYMKQDEIAYRIYDITFGVVCDDVWPQEG